VPFSPTELITARWILVSAGRVGGVPPFSRKVLSSAQLEAKAPGIRFKEMTEVYGT
jgi:hypothetical protein